MAIWGKQKYSTVKVKKVQIPDGRWLKCSSCNALIDAKAMEKNYRTCPKCKFHFKMSARERIALMVDEDTFVEMDTNIEPMDPLNFFDKESYAEKLKSTKEKTGLTEAVITGTGEIGGVKTGFGAMDFSYMGGSMGSVVGEKITRLAEHCLKEHLPLVICCTSGGARMQESTLSLMQMAKTSAAASRLDEAGLLFIVILTNPTMAGVMASYASLGDVIIAEPGALIGFTGPRVIQQTIKQELPDGFQQSDFQLQHGMLDMIVPRSELKGKVAHLLEFMSK